MELNRSDECTNWMCLLWSRLKIQSVLNEAHLLNVNVCPWTESMPFSRFFDLPDYINIPIDLGKHLLWSICIWTSLKYQSSHLVFRWVLNLANQQFHGMNVMKLTFTTFQCFLPNFHLIKRNSSFTNEEKEFFFIWLSPNEFMNSTM